MPLHPERARAATTTTKTTTITTTTTSASIREANAAAAEEEGARGRPTLKLPFRTMAINDLPTPTDSSKQQLRSYREATSYLVQNEQRKPLEPRCDSNKEHQPLPSPACGSPPRFRPSSSSRCRSRTPSPPHASTPSSSQASRESSKAPRSVSPGGTPASSAGAALRCSQQQQRGLQERRVRWANDLVSSVRTRPRTLREDAALLFYSRADEKRFRREAETAAVEDDWCEQLEEDSLTSLSDDEEEQPSSSDHKPLWSPQRERKDYAISKAVVIFGNSTRTYDGHAAGGCAIEAALEVEKESSLFDDAAFWNGQLTWS